MQCKNCDYPLETTHKFCANCGAKIIHNRLTLKILWKDFSKRFLNYDNTLLKTVRGMFSKPEVVIDSFIQGTRKKYLNPINFFLISLAITGLYNFLYKTFLLEETIAFYENAFKGFYQNDLASESSMKGFYFFMEYFNLFAFLSIPVNALVTKIAFLNYKKYNYTEHIVLNLYTISQYQLVVYSLFIPLLFLSIEVQNILSLLSIASLFFYFFYVLTRVFKLNTKQLFTKAFIIFTITSVVFLLLLILAIIIGVLYKVYM
ncbi:DUF3667 domain-containing protein [Kordia sp.]|uniref:DUF3667 domain-containing protein n=1 Tax=Kordia sp. TaxID=1965332 RepID=UPI003B5A593B